MLKLLVWAQRVVVVWHFVRCYFFTWFTILGSVLSHLWCLSFFLSNLHHHLENPPPQKSISVFFGSISSQPFSYDENLSNGEADFSPIFLSWSWPLFKSFVVKTLLCAAGVQDLFQWLSFISSLSSLFWALFFKIRKRVLQSTGHVRNKILNFADFWVHKNFSHQRILWLSRLWSCHHWNWIAILWGGLTKQYVRPCFGDLDIWMNFSSNINLAWLLQSWELSKAENSRRISNVGLDCCLVAVDVPW